MILRFSNPLQLFRLHKSHIVLHVAALFFLCRPFSFINASTEVLVSGGKKFHYKITSFEREDLFVHQSDNKPAL